ncbi:hypothetical protein AMUR21_04733 (plasmid) [Escherichia coli]|nr:hypothetical protein AMUR21_04733 [Escherichia coli]
MTHSTIKQLTIKAILEYIEDNIRVKVSILNSSFFLVTVGDICNLCLSLTWEYP